MECYIRNPLSNVCGHILTEEVIFAHDSKFLKYEKLYRNKLAEVSVIISYDYLNGWIG